LVLFAETLEAAQELSTFIYPSEDELQEAFQNGEIGFDQLITLQEIIQFGIDSTQLYLLDEIPNLSSFWMTNRPEDSGLSLEQEKPFLEEPPEPRTIQARFSHDFAQKLEDKGQSRYRTFGEINAGNGLKAAFRLHREYSGVERFVYRRLEFKPKNSPIRRIVLGNYTARLGLGTVLGYRGKLLDFSNEINGESILYPDYGGSNGLDLELKAGNSSGQLVFSQQRDTDYSIRTIGASFGQSIHNWSPMAVASTTNLRNRLNGASIDDFKYGVNIRSEYHNGYTQIEISAQSGEKNSFGAAVIEGKHISGTTKIAYAGWLYDDNYIDLTGGSKAGNLRRASEIEDVDFRFSDKRSGQEGGLLKTEVELTNNTDLISSFIYAGRDKDDYNFEFLSAIENKINSGWNLRIDHVSRFKHRLESLQEVEDIFRRSRVELRFVNPAVYVRTYLAYQSKTGSDDYMAFFINSRYTTRRGSELSLWFNLGEFKHNQGRVDYWYGFIENRNKLFDNVRTIAKFTHSFRRGRADEHLSTISVGLEVTL